MLAGRALLPSELFTVLSFPLPLFLSRGGMRTNTQQTMAWLLRSLTGSAQYLL